MRQKTHQKGQIKKFRKPNIPLRRKIALIYARCLFIIKVSLVGFICLFFFTNYFRSIRQDIVQHIHELTEDIGFKLNNVMIEGQQNISSDKILMAINADKSTPIFSINLQQVKEALEKNDWVKAAAIERKLPGTLYIAILERTPIAIWQVDQKLYLIDEEGFKIHANDIEKFSYLLHIVGKDANIYAYRLIEDLDKYPEFRKKVVSAVRYSDRRWNLNLEQNITIKMPESGFDKALAYIAELNRRNKLFNQGFKSLDMRNPDKYYIEKF